MGTTRAAAFAAIDSERAYQDAKWGTGPDRLHTVTEWLVYIQDYAAESLHNL